MTYPVLLPFRQGAAVKFPARCAGCGAPPVTTSALVLHRLVARGDHQDNVEAKLDVPHCARCAQLTKAAFLAGCLPFVGGGLLIGLAAFALGFYVSARLDLDQFDDGETWPSLVIGGALGLIAGLVGGFVAELLARVVLTPFLGRALWRAPLLAVQLLRDSDRVAGLTGRLAPDASQLQLHFDLDDVGREVQALNPA